MNIRIFCPACGKKLKVSSDQVGQPLACPRCQEGLVVDARGTPTLVSSPVHADHDFCPRKVRPEEDLIDMTAMVDIVFFLLIFFMVTSMHSKQAALDVSRPEASGNTAGRASRDNEVREQEEVVVRVDSDNSIWVNEDRAPSRQELLSLLREACGASPWKTRVQVRAHGAAEHGTVVMVLDAGGVLGLGRMQLITDAGL